jgi:hypothetical protein
VVRNEVAFTYGPWGGVEKIEAANDGPVVPGTTPAVVQTWSFPAAGEAAVRRSSVAYPIGGPTIADDYSLGLDGALNRLSGRKRSGSWLFRESYEGAGRLSGRRLGADGVGDLRWSAAPDRFGRLRDLTVLDHMRALTVNSFRYTYDPAGRVTFRENLSVDCYGYASFSEAYAHDGLGRRVLRQRGRTFSPGQTTLYTVHETESFAWDPGDHATEYYWGSTAGPGDPTRHIYNATNEIEGRLVPGGAWEDWADYDPEGISSRRGSRTRGTSSPWTPGTGWSRRGGTRRSSRATSGTRRGGSRRS